MPYRGEWYIPYKVMEARLWGNVEVADLQAHTERCVEFMSAAQRDSPDQHLYLLLDCMDVESMPAIYRLISVAAPVMRFKNRTGPVFVATTSRKVKSIIEITGHVMNFPTSSHESREVAIRALEAQMQKDALQSVT